jgi:hypothetical protein
VGDEETDDTSSGGDRRTRVLLVVGGVILGIAVTVRLFIAIVNASVLQSGGTAFSAIDVVLLIVGLCALAVLATGCVVQLLYRRTTHLVETAHPGTVVLPVGVRQEEIDLLQRYGRNRGLTMTKVAVVVATQDACVWWTGIGKARKVAEIQSETPIQYHLGEYDHGLRKWLGLLARLTVGGEVLIMPIPVAPSAILPIPPNAEKLKHIVRDLRKLSTPGILSD